MSSRGAAQLRELDLAGDDRDPASTRRASALRAPLLAQPVRGVRVAVRELHDAVRAPALGEERVRVLGQVAGEPQRHAALTDR
jgi:hypothetical protein